MNRQVLFVLLILLAVFIAGCAAANTAADQDPGQAVLADPQGLPVEEPAVDQIPGDQSPDVENGTDPAISGDGDQDSGTEQQMLDGAVLLDDRCAVCHSPETASSKAKTLAEWESTIDRMIQKGAQLSPDERDILAAYLAETAGQ